MSIQVNKIEIVPTIFPDKTSQIWKIDKRILESKNMTIEFNFEHEGEIFHLQQLMSLIRHARVPHPIKLHMPYLPYGRQDKEISNESTFALKTFAGVINNLGFNEVSTLDAHSKIAGELFNNFTNIHPVKEIRQAHLCVSDLETDAYNTILAYPDKGASERYGYAVGEIVGHKVRDQSTGYITSYEMEGNPKGKDVLIIDDICDGGMTFILFAKQLLTNGAKSVNLYVTHGIFSKGIEVLKEAGIDRIFTKNGEIK